MENTTEPKEYSRTDIKWIMNRYEKCSDRYLEAEKELLEILEMSFFKRLFLKMRILKFLDSRGKKYNF